MSKPNCECGSSPEDICFYRNKETGEICCCHCVNHIADMRKLPEYKSETRVNGG